jgi:hypothetical protein
MRPMIVSMRLATADVAPVLLRLDSGSNAAVLYAAPRLLRASVSRAPMLQRVVNGAEQGFAVLAAQEVRMGVFAVRQMSFLIPMNGLGGGPSPREDGLPPTAAFKRAFISYSENYAALDLWLR